jgi:hypothetical protein
MGALHALMCFCSNGYERSLRYTAKRSSTQGMERGLSFLRGTP